VTSACIIDQEFLGCTAKVVKASLDRFEDRRLGLVQTDGVVLASAVAERQAAEHDHLGELTTQVQRVGRPIELTLPTGWRLEAHRGLAQRCGRPYLLQIRVQGRRAASVAELAQLAQDA
jgi:hypothetical protein